MPKHELNDFQEAVLEALADTHTSAERLCYIDRDELLQRVQGTPGFDDTSHQRLGPCTKSLCRRGLIEEPRSGRFYLTDAGAEALGSLPALPGETEPQPTPDPDADSSVEEPFTVTGVCEEPEPAPDPVTRVDPETRRVILPATKEEIDAANIATGFPGDYVDPGYHAGPAECLGGLHYPPEAETLQEGSALYWVEQQNDHAADPAKPHITTLMVAVHPPGTAWLGTDATVLVKIEDEGAGPYLDISSWDGPATIESLAMLEAVTDVARRLLSEAERSDS